MKIFFKDKVKIKTFSDEGKLRGSLPVDLLWRNNWRKSSKQKENDRKRKHQEKRTVDRIKIFHHQSVISENI